MGLMALRPRALIVGRADPSGSPSVPADFIPDPVLSDAPLPEVVSPVVEGDGVWRQHWPAETHRGRRGQPVACAPRLPLGTHESDVNLVSVPMGQTPECTATVIGLPMGHHLVLMPRFEPAEFLRLVTDHRVTVPCTVPTIMHRLLPVYRRRPGRLRSLFDPSVLARRCTLPARCQSAMDRIARSRFALGTLRRHRTSGVGPR